MGWTPVHLLFGLYKRPSVFEHGDDLCTLSHYKSITKPRAWFLLSLLKHLTIDFPSHFILSIIDVHLDSTSHDKFIFPSAITRILRHFSIPFPMFNHFTHICAIDAAIVKCSEMQFKSRQESTALPFPFGSISICFIHIRSLLFLERCVSDVSLVDIMAQLQRMDARLDTLSIELY